MKPFVSVTLFVISASFFQTRTSDVDVSPRVTPDKPTVYLEYVCQNSLKVYLRMCNNTIWHIDVTMSDPYYSTKRIKLRNGIDTYASPDDKEISLRYSVEKFALPWESVKVPKLSTPDNGFSGWIASRDSVLFSVPLEYLRKDLQIAVRFNYEWEVTAKGYTINDPEHRVSFRGIDLPNTKVVLCGNEKQKSVDEHWKK